MLRNLFEAKLLLLYKDPIKNTLFSHISVYDLPALEKIHENEQKDCISFVIQTKKFLD